MMTRDDLNKAQILVMELQTIERGLNELKAGANIQSMTIGGGITPEPPRQMVSPIAGDIPPPAPLMITPMGSFVTLQNMKLPPELLERLVEHLQQRLQQIGNELHEMGIDNGSQTEHQRRRDDQPA